ncbi:MAG: Asp-tRNA(Asn)/Glu-tRNA(Gln) amidotransferase subunit GatB [Patescibacteria group bacterium]
MQLETVIGLEIHVQLKTKSKMFCSCDNAGEFAPPNTTICPICVGHPGTLPVPNRTAIEWSVKAAKAIGCRINPVSKFDRKHYFYPDLPKGYQISQYDQPIGVDGALDVDVDGKPVRVRFERLHLEEDAAKNFHRDGATLVDFNRCGTPLMEIVTKPDMRTPAQAKTFLQELRRIMRAVGVSDADMEKGHLRCDANISLRPAGEEKLYPKTEIKNINSFRSVERALTFEIERQTKLWNDGTPVDRLSTRGWNDDRGSTEEQRVKEEAADYRYFPDPDLPPMNLREIEAAVTLPELPQATRTRLMREYALSPEDAFTLTESREWISFTEAVFSELYAWLSSLPAEERKPEHATLGKLTGGWLTSKLLGKMGERGMALSDLKITPEDFAELVTLVATEKVSSTGAQKLLDLMLDSGADPSHLMEEHGLGQVRDAAVIEAAVARVIEGNPDAVAKYRAGKTEVIKFLLGMVMKETEGKADPRVAEELLKNKLSS